MLATLRSVRSKPSLFEAERSRYPDQLQIFELDVTSADDRASLLREIEIQNLSIDCLVNNAGYGLFGAFEDLSEEQIRKQFEVNVFGLMFLTQLLLPNLRKSKGRILNLSSAVGFLGLPFTSLYASSKFALEGFSESLYYELRPFGVQVCLVEPGRHRTSFSQKLTYGEKSFDPFSPYFRYTKAFKEVRDAHSKGPGTPSYHVVDKIIKLSEARQIPLRVPLGVDAKSGFYLKKFLPAGLFHALLSLSFRRFFRGQR